MRLNLSIHFVRMRYISYGIAILLTLATFASLATRGMNFGIDFKGGLTMEIRTSAPANVPELRKTLSELGIGEVMIQEFGSPTDILIRIENPADGEKGQKVVVQKVKDALGTDVSYRRVETVGPKAGEDLISNGFWAVVWAILAMLVYIWVRFEWNFGLCAMIALLHDAVVVVGFYTWTGLEFNITAIVAILITIGYSINDTVVIYDRIREMLVKYKVMAIPELIDKSINDTLTRTVLTSGSTLLALLALYFLGGPIIATYSLPIIVGVLIGTYSSIFLAAPLLLLFNIRPPKSTEDGPPSESNVYALNVGAKR